LQAAVVSCKSADLAAKPHCLSSKKMPFSHPVGAYFCFLPQLLLAKAQRKGAEQGILSHYPQCTKFQCSFWLFYINLYFIYI
jgi:hypothetical protein